VEKGAAATFMAIKQTTANMKPAKNAIQCVRTTRMQFVIAFLSKTLIARPTAHNGQTQNRNQNPGVYLVFCSTAEDASGYYLVRLAATI
jgi:hypothetical protein